MADRFTTHVAVYILVRNHKGEILLQQRANTGFLDGYWDLPSGHVESGESVLEAACRELKEEVCLAVSPDKLRLVHLNHNYLDVAYMNFTFVAENWEGEPKIGEPDKCSGIAFYAPDNLPEKCSLGVRVNERAGFPNEMTYSKVTPDNFESFMHEPFDAATFGKK